MQHPQRLRAGRQHRELDGPEGERARLPDGVRRDPGAEGDAGTERAGEETSGGHPARLPHGLHNDPMSELKDRLRNDLTTAIKARDQMRSSTLRMVLSAITNAEVAGKEARELSDDDVIGVLSTEAKKRREAATAFSDAGRGELADKETAEAAVIAEYLPEQLDAAAIAELVTAAIEQTGAADEGARAMGKVMGVVQPQVRGRADGAAVAAEVRRQLEP